MLNVMVLVKEVLVKYPMDFMEVLDIEEDFDKKVGMTTETPELFDLALEAYKQYGKTRERFVKSILLRSLEGRKLNLAEIKEVLIYNHVLELLTCGYEEDF